MNTDCFALTAVASYEVLSDLGGGIWRSQPALFHFVEGHLHKIEWPGFSTRSGECFGISATVHVLSTGTSGDGRRCEVRRLVFDNGKLLSHSTVPGEHRISSYR